MDLATLLRHERAVPRYTSYPTAAQFHAGVGAATYRGWLRALPEGRPISLYAHIPFCRSICWYCACHTQVARRADDLAAYARLGAQELDMIAADIGEGRPLVAIQFGGGTPTEIGGAALKRLIARATARFRLAPGAEISVETDPRYVSRSLVASLAAAGVTRASLGVQDFDPVVQRAINRLQPEETTRACVAMLRGAGIDRVNVDLVYGLPRQTLETLARTLTTTIDLRPSRIAVFGYAHVPWMSKRQRAIDEAALPDMAARHAMAALVAARLEGAGYRRIGLDHYALPDDPLALAAEVGAVRRNFQGYTDVPAVPMIGLGATAISLLPDGYAQNATKVADYAAAIGERRYATARGVAVRPEDRLVGDVIERLMCDFEVDLDEVADRHGMPSGAFVDDLARLRPYAEDGIVRIDGARVRVAEAARDGVRLVCAAFDHHLPASGGRHSRAV
ncbi:MAG: oxygen-independent coproporphyrinogen III oxidase [Rhodospirillales bacterium]|nr:MAG: oxygen-independent coproporphyrinogen III oxidase [Rhodospirillales bacterium]